MTWYVYRAKRDVVPVGCNALLYVGSSARAARDVYRRAAVGVTPWGRSDPDYGVALCRWSGDYRDDTVIVSWRGM